MNTLTSWHEAFNEAAAWQPHPLTLTRLVWDEQRDDLMRVEFVYRGVSLIGRLDAQYFNGVALGLFVLSAANVSIIVSTQSANRHERWVDLLPSVILENAVMRFKEQYPHLLT